MSRKLKLLRWIPLLSILGDPWGCFPVGGMTPESLSTRAAPVVIEADSAQPAPVEGIVLPEANRDSSNR